MTCRISGTLGSTALVAVLVAGWSLSALAQGPPSQQGWPSQPGWQGAPQRTAPARAAAPKATLPLATLGVDRCADRSRTLGVDRVASIDTTGGPRFGHQQYKEQPLLADGEIVLTFDDGPLRVHTQAVVDALEAQCTKATFFMVGSQALADPDMVRQIARKGHTIGTHTYSHANLRQMDPLRARREIELGFSAVAQAAGQPIAPFFRFPFLADTKAMKGMLETRGIGAFSIEVDALDYRNKEFPEAVQQEVLKQLAYQKKGILLFHDIQPSTAAALPGLLAALRAKGYKVVHLKSTAPAVTLPEFDALARKDVGARRVATAANPLANRAVTWPLAKTPTGPAIVPYTGPIGVPVQQQQPWVAPAPVAAPLPVRPPRPRPPDDDWRRGVLGR
jgi:peptidoglycan-N-acetylglucosamine deacetylase